MSHDHHHSGDGPRNIWVEDMIWIEDTPEGGLVLRFGQFGRLLETSPGHLDAPPALSAWIGEGVRPPRLVLEARHDGFAILGADAGACVQAEDLSVAVIHADDLPGRKPMLYARWHPQGAWADPAPRLNLDMIPQEGTGTVRLLFRGEPLAGARADLLDAEGEAVALTSDEAGRLRLPALGAGLHQLVCSHTEQIPARVGGKSYGGTRHWSTLTFRRGGA